MSLMLKLSTALLATTLLSNASFNLDEYVKKDLIKNPQIKVKGVELISKKDLPDAKGWTAYMFLMKLDVKNKVDDFPETVYVNENSGLVSMNLYNFKTHKLIGKDLRPEIDASYYDNAHLIAGKKDAKHKLVVFSDPMCPFCQKYVPTIYEDVKAHPDDFALYYYHMPLKRIHPVSETLTKVMEVLQHKGKIDEAMSMYKLNIPLRETNATKILEAVNKQFKISISEKEIKQPEIENTIKTDIKKATRVMLKGTPTVYIDGKYDPEVTSYKKLITSSKKEATESKK